MAWFDAHLERLRPKILAALAETSVEDRHSGRATGILAERLEGEDAGYVSNALLEMERAGEVVREVKGRRTYMIRLPRPDDDMEAIRREVDARVELLVKQRMAGTERKKAAEARVLALVPDEDHTDAHGAGPASVGSQRPPTPVPGRVHPSVPMSMPKGEIDLGMLASRLLEAAIDAANAPKRQQHELEQTVRRLGEQTEQTQRLRTKLREAEDLVVALQRDNDGLRARAQRAEENLNKMTGVRPLDQRREQELRELARTMQAKPGAYAGNVAK